jgi:hypothetical protein
MKQKISLLLIFLFASLFVSAATKPLIFGSHLGNFEFKTDALWLGWRNADGTLDEKIVREDVRLAANAGTGATRLFKPTFELSVGANLWDVSKFDEREFDIARKAIAICREFNVQPWLTMWFNHSEPTPWKNNVQGLKDPYSSIALSEAYVEKVVTELGADIYYEIICEPAYKGSGTSASYMNAGSSSYWLAKMIEKFWSLGVAADHICYGAELVYTYDKTTKQFKVNTTRDMVGQAAEVVRVDLKKKGWSLQKINDALNAGWQTQHTCAYAGEIVDGVTWALGRESQFCADTWGKANALRRVIASDDGTRIKPGPGERWTRPTPTQEYISARGLLLQYTWPKGLAIEVLGYKHNNEIYAQLREVSRAVKEATGSWPENWKRFAAPIDEPPPTDDPVEPPPTDPAAAKLGLLAAIAAAIVASWKKLVAWYRLKGSWWWWLVLLAAIVCVVLLIALIV